jgi:hypothetical protein
MGLKSTIFGKAPKPQTQESGNHAYDEINSAFKPGFGYFSKGGDMISNLLGAGGAGAQTGALDNFANSGGMNFLREQGTRQIQSSAAARGMLHSGSTLKALEKYGQGLGSTYLSQYMDNLFKMSGLGLQAGGLVSSTGQYSKGTGQTAGKTGALPMALQVASMIPGISDRRLKENIVHVGELSDGLKVYEYDLFGERKRGVMADEVATIRPSAYLPGHYGEYDGVDYSKIGDLNA